MTRTLAELDEISAATAALIRILGDGRREPELDGALDAVASLSPAFAALRKKAEAEAEVMRDVCCETLAWKDAGVDADECMDRIMRVTHHSDPGGPCLMKKPQPGTAMVALSSLAGMASECESLRAQVTALQRALTLKEELLRAHRRHPGDQATQDALSADLEATRAAVAKRYEPEGL